MDKKDIDQILTHLGEEHDQYFGAMAPPIIQTSNFVFPTIQDFRESILEEMDHHVYTRGNNPTVHILRKKLAALENTEDALVVSSGSGAIATAVLAFVEAGDHIVCVNNPYSWTSKLLVDFLPRFGISTTFVDGTDNQEIESAITDKTKILYLESPNSLLFDLQDLTFCGKLAQRHQIISMIDNSYSTPLYQNPADFGIDIILHSATKYLNGHSDVVAGVIAGSTENIKKIFLSPYMTLGNIISPNDAWLMLRGMRTLPVRMEKCSNTTHEIIKVLEQHPKVKKIIYPFHHSHPQHALAKKQMSGCGSLFTLELDVDSKDQVYQFVEAIQCFKMAVSWGGYESIMLPSLVFHDMPGRPDSPIPWNYIRISCGLEDSDYLISDLQAALMNI